MIPSVHLQSEMVKRTLYLSTSYVLIAKIVAIMIKKMEGPGCVLSCNSDVSDGGSGKGECCSGSSDKEGN